MTTIIATRNALYSDSKCSAGDSHFETPKLFQVGDSLLGISGTLTAALKFIKWFEKQDPDEPPILDQEDGFDVLEVSPRGVFVWDRDLTPMEIRNPFYAVGSGYMAALAALHLGSSPEVAIETACKVDRASGGPLQVLRLNEPSHLSPPNDHSTNTKGPNRSPRKRSSRPKE